VLPELDRAVGGVVDLLARMPLIGRTLTIKPVGDGADMNPWLLEVIGMPSTVRHMTTYDFLHTPQSVLNMRAISAAANGSDSDSDSDLIPRGTINHLLLLPGSLGMGGWMHAPATYLLLRNETLYHRDAWMSTMAATVVYLLQQHVETEWVRAELARVRAAFEGVYTERNAGDFFAFMAQLSTHEYRRCLPTESPALPRHCKCPHLTKFIFAVWLVGETKPWTGAQLQNFQLALLVEFMHRAGVTLQLRHTLRITPQQWLDENVATPRGEWFLRHATVEDAQNAWARKIEGFLQHVPSSDVIKNVAVAQNVFKARHMQFTYSGIVFMFRSLWALSGVAPYRFSTTTLDLVPLLRSAAIHDNATRVSDPCFATAIEEAELHRLAAGPAIRAFRAGVLEAASAIVAAKYAGASVGVHGGALAGVPTLFLPDYMDTFERVYRADLRGRFAVQENGLSGVACCIPACSHYLVPLGTPRAQGIHPRLRSHIGSAAAVPGLHKVPPAHRHTRGHGIFY
jgi:hypothetical protein